jgi:hypothetical protein
MYAARSHRITHWFTHWRRVWLLILAVLAAGWGPVTPRAARAQPTGDTAAGATYSLPFAWQGDAIVAAAELSATAPPLDASGSEGEFQIAYVPAETGDVLRVLPGAETVGGRFVMQWALTPASEDPAIPAGQIVSFALRARVFGQDATARLFIGDDTGSSSVAITELTWAGYQIARHIPADAQNVVIGVEWAGVNAGSWLEVQGMAVTVLDTAAGALPAPTDTPTPPGFVPTPVPTPTPTPTVAGGLLGAATATPLPTPTSELIVVTSTPTPVDVLEEATRVAQATDWARILGPATPTPPNLATVTPTPTPHLVIVTNTPVPGNAATATYAALVATAVAFTTGTPTPIPPEATVVVATAMPVPTLRPAAATRTPTPIFVLLADIPTPEAAPTAVFPQALMGKIVFLSDIGGNRNRPNAMVMNPDGSEIGVLTSNVFYNRANERDAWSADRRFYVYALRAGGAANSGLVQIFHDDAQYPGARTQLTFFGSGTAWSPAWSPKRNVVALVSSDTRNDEIWLVEPGVWPPIQLTHNDWEWDHHPSFSPDGNEIVFMSNRETGRRQLWVMDIGGENVRQLTNFTFEAWDPVWVKYPDS